ncbi:hypothetical protein LEP1GSC082_2162 [Leptospira kirschneri str. H2]|uniref:Uncharacterized protein n=1 Tax=Leptospira kirschneri serovar Bulgarica str. Nikolaevo TaxID=1240687 RepID=M6FCD4_9LEPT|nr:hypothetical protein LEP1GSC082_2162 [Leptospira kirschneri str. H2]EMK23694.1 hypothetical protein LEP1GSC008_0543 [Leptospira kirschneri serovar Bulgarica str. Nikolaevo]
MYIQINEHCQIRFFYLEFFYFRIFSFRSTEEIQQENALLEFRI